MDKTDIYDQIDWDNYAKNYGELFAAVKAGSQIMIIPHDSPTGEPVPMELVTKFNKERIELPIYKEEEPQAIEPVSITEQIEAAAALIETDKPQTDLNLAPQDKELLSCMTEAQLLSQFCEAAISRVNDSEAKLEAWNHIAIDYNLGLLVPELFQIRGKRTERSLRKWVDAYLESNRDMFALIHKSKNQTRGRKVTYLEQHFLMKLLLSPQKIKIGSAVATVKAFARLGNLESPSSVPTLKRWCKDYKLNNLAV